MDYGCANFRQNCHFTPGRQVRAEEAAKHAGKLEVLKIEKERQHQEFLRELAEQENSRIKLEEELVQHKKREEERIEKKAAEAAKKLAEVKTARAAATTRLVAEEANSPEKIELVAEHRTANSSEKSEEKQRWHAAADGHVEADIEELCHAAADGHEDDFGVSSDGDDAEISELVAEEANSSGTRVKPEWHASADGHVEAKGEEWCHAATDGHEKWKRRRNKLTETLPIAAAPSFSQVPLEPPLMKSWKRRRKKISRKPQKRRERPRKQRKELEEMPVSKSRPLVSFTKNSKVNDSVFRMRENSLRSCGFFARMTCDPGIS